MVKRKQFTSEFKREAVRMMDSSEKPSSEVALELGVRRNQLYVEPSRHSLRKTSGGQTEKSGWNRDSAQAQIPARVLISSEHSSGSQPVEVAVCSKPTEPDMEGRRDVFCHSSRMALSGGLNRSV